MELPNRLFKPNSSTSPVGDKRKSNPLNTKKFRRSDSSNKLLDKKNDSNQKSDRRPSDYNKNTFDSDTNQLKSNPILLPSAPSQQQQNSSLVPNNKVYSASTLNANTDAMIMNKSEPTTKNSQNTTENLNEADEYIQMAIKFHESNELEKATYYFRMAADRNSPLGLFLYGIALRHGWGCKPDPMLAVQYLRQAANSAISDLQATVEANPTIARHELVLAIYELGICFRHGWGVAKNKQMAAHYFEMAANFGDPDAQNDLAFCYLHGEGVKKDMKKAAKYYRMADTQGAGTLGNSWIYKKKYVEDNK
nr:9805_t:CDS:2 [Entrophospora candida]